MKHKHLQRYVRRMADLMGLRDWEVHVDKGHPDDEEHQADVQVAENRRYATIRFGADWRSWTPEHLRQTVAHELVHLHLDALHRGLTPVGEHFAQITWNVFYRFYQRDLELATEAISVAWSATLPLPPVKAD